MFFASTMVMVSIALVMAVIVTYVYAKRNSSERCSGWFLSLAISCLKIKALDYLEISNQNQSFDLNTSYEQTEVTTPKTSKLFKSKSNMNKQIHEEPKNLTNSPRFVEPPPTYLRKSTTGISFISNPDLDSKIKCSYGFNLEKLLSSSLELNNERNHNKKENESTYRHVSNENLDYKIRTIRPSLEKCKKLETLDDPSFITSFQAMSSPTICSETSYVQNFKNIAIPPPPTQVPKECQPSKWKKLKMTHLKKRKNYNIQDKDMRKPGLLKKIINQQNIERNKALNIEKKERERIKAEWRIAAMFIDQIFFWIFLGLSFITNLTLVYQMIW